MFKSIYRWTLALSQSRHAPLALGAVAFAESSFFPVPPDLILVPMALARPQRAWAYATICTVASVLGGMLGYAIGALLYDTVGQWLIAVYHYADKMEAMRAAYAQWGWLLILIKGLTPIPYKLVTIVSGLLGYNFGLFVLLSIITRGARFFILAGLLNRFGDPIRGALERHFAAILIGFILLIVVGFYVATHVI
ncbi:YqaA family protein [Lichenibacterium ramalinae]|uniref:DedA family protein n=1 Tax=Lichenibacterium ramalinae TaxID=2316527 RepID=A0A4Q2RH84_9HYPH|nr:YqaA family protein [Lichenibacterium ramalinae]RYB06008.1 DedA family protein [Lichenibacterium ramalinae]